MIVDPDQETRSGNKMGGAVQVEQLVLAPKWCHL